MKYILILSLLLIFTPQIFGDQRDNSKYKNFQSCHAYPCYDVWNYNSMDKDWGIPLRWQPDGGLLYTFGKKFKWEKLKENKDSIVYIDTTNVKPSNYGTYFLWGLIDYNSGDSKIYLHEYACDITSLRVPDRVGMDKVLLGEKDEWEVNTLEARTERSFSKEKSAISKLRYRTFKGRIEENNPIFDTYYDGDRSKGYAKYADFELLNETDANRYRELGIGDCRTQNVDLKKTLKDLEENQEKTRKDPNYIAMMEKKKEKANKFLELTKFSNLKECQGSPLKGIDRPYYATYASKNGWTDCKATVYVREEIYMDKERVKEWEKIKKTIKSLHESKFPSFLQPSMKADWLAKKKNDLILWEKRLLVYEREKNEIKKLQLENPIRIVKYIGEYKSGLMHGKGIVIYNNGDKYVGEFKKNKRDGQGTLYYKDHSIEGKSDRKQAGSWKDDKIIRDYRSQ
tara:strand:- start:379 stop:1743 length:1365 start_codon:yes stop_codon:yes gene_type:complete